MVRLLQFVQISYNLGNKEKFKRGKSQSAQMSLHTMGNNPNSYSQVSDKIFAEFPSSIVDFSQKLASTFVHQHLKFLSGKSIFFSYSFEDIVQEYIRSGKNLWLWKRDGCKNSQSCSLIVRKDQQVKKHTTENGDIVICESYGLSPEVHREEEVINKLSVAYIWSFITQNSTHQSSSSANHKDLCILEFSHATEVRNLMKNLYLPNQPSFNYQMVKPPLDESNNCAIISHTGKFTVSVKNYQSPSIISLRPFKQIGRNIESVDMSLHSSEENFQLPECFQSGEIKVVLRFGNPLIDCDIICLCLSTPPASLYSFTNSFLPNSFSFSSSLNATFNSKPFSLSNPSSSSSLNKPPPSSPAVMKNKLNAIPLISKIPSSPSNLLQFQFLTNKSASTSRSLSKSNENSNSLRFGKSLNKNETILKLSISTNTTTSTTAPTTTTTTSTISPSPSPSPSSSSHLLKNSFPPSLSHLSLHPSSTPPPPPGSSSSSSSPGTQSHPINLSSSAPPSPFPSPSPSAPSGFQSHPISLSSSSAPSSSPSAPISSQ